MVVAETKRLNDELRTYKQALARQNRLIEAIKSALAYGDSLEAQVAVDQESEPIAQPPIQQPQEPAGESAELAEDDAMGEGRWI